MSGPIRVVVADDHPIVRAGIVGLLDAEPGIEVVGEAVDGAEAVALAAELRPDLVLMDLRMPVLDGAEATERILAAGVARRAGRAARACSCSRPTRPTTTSSRRSRRVRAATC